MSKDSESYNTVIIGAGPGGYAAAIRLGQYGYEPIVIEREEIGGVCLNWGCIPTKALYSTTDPLAKAGSWEKRGIQVEGLGFDLTKIRKHQAKVVSSLTQGIEKLLKANGAELIRGEAQLLPDKKVEITKPEGETTILDPENLILATGSQPIELPGFPFEHEAIWSSKDAVGLPEIPDKLAILGGGVIGLEMATIYNRMGSEVTVIEMEKNILPGMNLDDRTSAYLRRALKKQGIRLETETRAEKLKEDPPELNVIGKSGDKNQTFPADKVLVAVGRRPLTETLGEHLDFETKEDGSVFTDQNCETNREGVYAIGDLAGPPLLAHKATREGLIASAAIAGKTIDHYSTVPAAVFTDPEYAEVGLSQQQARQQGFEPGAGQFPFRASGKALAMDEQVGMVQLVVDKNTDQLLGGSILGANASDLIAEIGLAVEEGLTASQLANTIHAHPTLAEAIMEAAENFHDQSIHTVNKSRTPS